MLERFAIGPAQFIVSTDAFWFWFAIFIKGVKKTDLILSIIEVESFMPEEFKVLLLITIAALNHCNWY